jgi:hypothetical protein
LLGYVKVNNVVKLASINQIKKFRDRNIGFIGNNSKKFETNELPVKDLQILRHLSSRESFEESDVESDGFIDVEADAGRPKRIIRMPSK